MSRLSRQDLDMLADRLTDAMLSAADGLMVAREIDQALAREEVEDEKEELAY